MYFLLKNVNTMLNIFFILLFGISQTVLVDSKSCKVPNIQNGDFGKYISSVDFKKFLEGEDVKPDETLYIRCQDGFYPTENLIIHVSNLFEVKCTDGSWSKILQCKAAPCLGKPPKIDNGKSIIHSRQHGSTVRYKCNNSNVTMKSNVTCDFGSWTGNTPKCLNRFCYVPDVENGEMGQFENRSISRLNTATEFKKFSTGTQVNHNATLLLRCNGDFIPTDDSIIFENNVLEVTCNDGTWSKSFWCKQTSCPGDPPEVKNGRALFRSRKHGARAYYRCDERRYRKRPDIVKCHFGSWIGTVPKCLNSSCNTSLINYPGLQKPSEELLSSTESFEIACEYGFRMSANQTKVTCLNGHWDLIENPCIEGDCEVSKVIGGEVRRMEFEPWNWNWKTFRYDRKYNYKIVHEGSFVSPGTALILYCHEPYSVHGNGKLSEELRCSEGKLSMDLLCFRGESDCQAPEKLPGSRLKFIPQKEIYKFGEKLTFFCPPGLNLNAESEIIMCLGNEWSKTRLPECEETTDLRCPRIDGKGIFNLQYSNERRIDSTAQVFCKEVDKKLEGSNIMTCLPNRTWSGSYPECTDYETCSRFPTLPELEVFYTKGASVGSNATFSCSPPNTLIGNPYAICQRNGTWSYPLPTCKVYSARTCSISELLTFLPDGVTADKTTIADEFLSPGSGVRLECEDNLIFRGNSEAICGNLGKWELGIFQCVMGCRLKINPSSHLLVQPIKDSYRAGEFIFLSCPPGEEMTIDVERVMCLGNTWSESVPDCKESKE